MLNCHNPIISGQANDTVPNAVECPREVPQHRLWLAPINNPTKNFFRGSRMFLVMKFNTCLFQKKINNNEIKKIIIYDSDDNSHKEARIFFCFANT